MAIATIKLRRDTLTNWELNNPILSEGEVALVTDLVGNILDMKIGNGINSFSSTAYFIPSSIQPQIDSKLDANQVLTPVPVGAVFTDTVYLKPASEPISYIVGLQDALNTFVVKVTGKDLVDTATFDTALINIFQAQSDITEIFSIFDINYTPAAMLTSIKTVDGAGSGLDADMVDGQEPSSLNTPSTLVSRDSFGNFDANTVTANIVGNVTGNISGTAPKLTTARTISIIGDGSGSVFFDGSSDVTISLVVNDDSHNHVITNIDGLQTALDSKVDDSQVLTNVPFGAVFTDTTYSATDMLTSIKTVDGVGSGLDADLFGGQLPSYYATQSDLTSAGGAVQLVWSGDYEIGSFSSGKIFNFLTAGLTAGGYVMEIGNSVGTTGGTNGIILVYYSANSCITGAYDAPFPYSYQLKPDNDGRFWVHTGTTVTAYIKNIYKLL